MSSGFGVDRGGVDSIAENTHDDHGNLGGLSDDDHSIYAKLAGRTGGQTLAGGDASGDDLTLDSTTHGTPGDVIIQDGSLTGSTSTALTIYGGPDAGDDLTLVATSNSTDGDIIFKSDATTERVRIDSAGKMSVGAPHTFPSSGVSYDSRLHVVDTATDQFAALLTQYGSGSAGGAYLGLAKSRHATPGSHTILQDGDVAGGIYFYGSDGVDFEPTASIVSTVNGTPGSGDMPGSLAFATTPNGSPSLTTHMRIDQAGHTLFGHSVSLESLFSRSATVQVVNNVDSYSGIDIHTFNAGVGGSYLTLCHSRSGTKGTHTILQNGDQLGGVLFGASDGTDYFAGAYILGVVEGTPGNNESPTALTFNVAADGAAGPAEQMRIQPDGGVAIGVADASSARLNVVGTTNEYVIYATSGSSNVPGFALQYAGTTTAHQAHTTSNAYGAVMYSALANTSASSGYYFFQGHSDLDGSGDNEVLLRGDGEMYADGAWNPSGADYAEMFEWKDGNPTAQDRRGISVVLDGKNIRPAKDTDAAADIIGVVSARPSVIGDAGGLKWDGRYVKDDFGAYVMEDYEIFTLPEGTKDSEGKLRVDITREQALKHGIEIPVDAPVVIQQRRKTNPNFDPSITYTPRRDRPEWAAVGLMGKLWVRNGQQIGDRWKLMKTGNNANLYLVR